METPGVWAGAWVVFTIAAAVLQTARNAMQSSLTRTLGTLGATHVRFLYGLPFSLVFLAVVGSVVGGGWPSPTPSFFAWVAIGGLTQIAATALMLAAMREQSFVVATAYVKTEPIQVAVFGLVFLGDRLGPLASAAVLVSTIGVVAMSWPKPGAAGETNRGSLRPALLGVAAGAMFAMASVGFRGAILALGEGSFVLHASVTLVAGLALQAATLSLWLWLRDPAVLRGVVAAWRASVPAGLAGAAGFTNFSSSMGTFCRTSRI